MIAMLGLVVMMMMVRTRMTRMTTNPAQPTITPPPLFTLQSNLIQSNPSNQLASRFPYGIMILSAAQSFYFAYYISTHESNEQGEVKQQQATFFLFSVSSD
jgi:hypothetical protein